MYIFTKPTRFKEPVMKTGRHLAMIIVVDIVIITTIAVQRGQGNHSLKYTNKSQFNCEQEFYTIFSSLNNNSIF